MDLAVLNSLTPSTVVDPDLVDRIRRERRFRVAGQLGALSSIAVYVVSQLVATPGGTATTVLGIVLGVSLLVIAWTRLWIRESREPFQYTFSVGEFESVPDSAPAAGPAQEPIEWLTRDLTEKLSERVQRLSILDEAPPSEPDDPPASHVHISGWYGFRHGETWELEVVPKVRLGGEGAPAKLAKAVHYKLRETPAGRYAQPPPISREDYQMMFERVYWSVASQIYAQIRHGVEEKVKLLPLGRLRAGAYLREADDYATSNTLDAYEAARKLYRRALELYDVGAREPPATKWRRRMALLLLQFDRVRRAFRAWRAGIWRRSGRLEVMTARAELGYARMLAAEWHLRLLCGMVPRDLFEAAPIVDRAIDRLEDVPPDVADQRATHFKAHVTQATIRLFLRDQPGARESLEKAERLLPARAREDADFLFAAGMIEPDRLRSLRLLGQAVDLNPTMERALFHRAQQYEEIWRRRHDFEPEVAEVVDAEYCAVTALNPGNLSAWANRGYLGWLLAEEEKVADAKRWRERAYDALEAGRQYKEVRREAVVAELDWNLARLAAEEGRFADAYEHYIAAVSAKLAQPRVEFETHFYMNATEALVARFKRYQERVAEGAKEARRQHAGGRRLVKSVLAFVLNDCGLAYLSHYERSGREEDLGHARRAFERARRENKGFVLPAFNLARLHDQMSRLEGESEESHLLIAAAQLEEVLRREPDWPPAQLLMAKVQAQQAVLLGQRKVALEDPGSPAPPVADATDGADVLPGLDPRVARLDVQRDACHQAVEEQLRKLLPHSCFITATGGTRLDVYGTHVEILAGDSTIRWAQDFSELHVAALVQWVDVLTANSLPAANVLCAKLRDVYYRADSALLFAHREVSLGLGGPSDGAVATECEGLLCEIVEVALEADPVHLFALKATFLLPEPERRRALANALEAGPSPSAVLWIAGQLQELEDVTGALEAYRSAAKDGRSSVAPVASLNLAELLEDRDEKSAAALSAFRGAIDSRNASVAAAGAAGAARVLLATGDDAGAEAVYESAAANPEMALALVRLVEEEERPDAAVAILERLLEQDDAEVERLAEARIRLGLLLRDDDGSVTAEAMEHLWAAASSGVAPIAWEAKVVLARILAANETERAEALYGEVIEEDDPTAVAFGAAELGALLEARQEGGQALALYRSCARDDPRARDQLVGLLRERDATAAADALLEGADAGVAAIA